MDIISEILQTDKLAEDKLKQAELKKLEIAAQSEQEQKKLHEDAVKTAEQYSAQAENKSDEKTQAVKFKLRADEREQIRKLEAVFENNHEKWENEIYDAVTGLH